MGDGARLSWFPHYSWLGFRMHGAPDKGPVAMHVRSVAHVIHMTFRGPHVRRLICRGSESRSYIPAGCVHFCPKDGEQRTVIAHRPPDFDSYLLFVPQRHLAEIAAQEGLPGHVHFQMMDVMDDRVLQSCMIRLAMPAAPRNGAADGCKDEAARRLVLRLVELNGGGRCDWHSDASVFDRRTLDHLVSYIDAHLHVAPSLSDMAQLVGLSPSHFARKFRQSTGLSLRRFINRRRLCGSLEKLKDESQSLAHLALDLGFSSQSHFTRIFSGLTGMTPLTYRKQVKRTPG